ncbi:hypothetical protein TeGR_g14371 [Tetraparma gracilis]|uniref:glutathione transferase n=1 Tax=Tetraparma gracilis TaxID=2962635 RepID=A0ABQ6N1A4_9STRA|nr:hypothetical protein TeGR_g14371 [Tetraparma gracilis]
MSRFQERAPISTGYWSIKGLGAPIRMMISWSGAPFEAKLYDVKMPGPDRKLDASAWFGSKKALKERNPFINLPYVDDSSCLISQTNACFSYLGRELGLWPSSPSDVIMAETLLCELMDLRNSMTNFAYSGAFEDVRADGLALLANVSGKNGVLQKIELHFANKVCRDFLVGGVCTAPDFHLYEMIDQYSTLAFFLEADSPFEQPQFANLKAFYNSFAAHPRNAYYLTSKLNQLPFNNKGARFGSVPGGGRFEAGQEYEWAEDWTGVYQNK